MAITSDKNQNYGPPLVSQKYSPLLNIAYSGAAGDRAVYSALLNNRWGLLNAAGILPQPLRLAVPNWAAMVAAEAGQNPPLVVISSNRSAWIAAGIAAADTELAYLGAAAFANASALTALGAHAGQTSSPPIYCPTRIGGAGPRSVFIVVHTSEYVTYQAALAGLGVTVVGWEFPAPSSRRVLTGFGASRFAAIEFCKELRTAVTAAGGAAWDYAWLFDDNVVALTSFPGYAAVETAMTNAAAPRVCAGFRGGTTAETFLTNRTWARAEVAAGRGVQTAALPVSATPAIVQQAALWNIDYLTTNHLNFGPVYLTSGEDLSFANYFNTRAIPYFHYNGIGVTKELAYSDDGAGAQATNRGRRILSAWFAYAESAGAAAPVVPPPVEIQPVAGADGAVQTLAAFITNRVLPNSQMAAAAGNVGVQNTAKCQAVEQITCGAINLGYVSGAAMNTTFQINGAAAQVVVQVDAP